jgi:hypothetical protein
MLPHKHANPMSRLASAPDPTAEGQCHPTAGPVPPSSRASAWGRALLQRLVQRVEAATTDDQDYQQLHVYAELGAATTAVPSPMHRTTRVAALHRATRVSASTSGESLATTAGAWRRGRGTMRLLWPRDG